MAWAVAANDATLGCEPSRPLLRTEHVGYSRFCGVCKITAREVTCFVCGRTLSEDQPDNWPVLKYGQRVAQADSVDQCRSAPAGVAA